MKLSAFALFLAFALPLAACEGVQEETTVRPVEYICAAATAGLKTVAVLDAKGQIDDNARRVITQAVVVINPTCSAAEPPTLSNQARIAMEQALGQLTSSIASAQK